MTPKQQTNEAKPWFVYLIRADTGALYCGISTDPIRRLAQHRSGRGARFFRTCTAQALVYVETCLSQGQALQREWAIKRLSKTAKEALVHLHSPASTGGE